MDPNVASVKVGGAENAAYGGFPQSDDPSVLDKMGNPAIADDTRSALAAYLDGVWERCKRHRGSNGIDEMLLRCMRQFNSINEPDVQAKLDARKAPSLFVPMSQHKAQTAIAWVDEFFTDGEKLFSLKPTPLPEVEQDVIQRTADETMADIAALEEQNGIKMPESVVREYAAQKRPIVEEAVDDEAKKRAIMMERVIKDDMVQGKWNERIHDVIENACIYGTAGLRTPVVRIGKRRRWDRKASKISVGARVVRSFESISPFDIFPSPGMTDTQSGDLIIRVKYRLNELADQRGTPCWINSAIESVLSHCGSGGVRLEVSSDSQRRCLASQMSEDRMEGLVEGYEFWGYVSGRSIRSVGIDKTPTGENIEDTDWDFYQVNAIVMSNEVVYCRVMREAEERPVDVVRFYDSPDSFFGIGPLQILAPIQSICNSAARAAIVNMAFASGPQVVVDQSCLDPSENCVLEQWKVWLARTNSMNPNARPVSIMGVDFIAQGLTNVFDFFQRLADELTGIPAFANGTDAATGAARTATGLNLLFGMANRNVKHVIGNFDRLSTRAIHRLWEWHMEYNPDQSIKGDVDIEVTGIKFFASKNQQATERLNLIARITQDERMKSMQGPMELAKMLHEVEIGFDLSPNTLAPALDDLKRKMAQDQEEAALAAQQQMILQEQMAAQNAQEMAPGGQMPEADGGLTPTGRPHYAPRPETAGSNA